MTPIAVSVGNLTIYYSSIVIALGVAACFLLTYSLYGSDGGRPAALAVYVPLAVVFSVLLSRVLHWYCHTEQYESFLQAVTNYRTGDFVLSGALIGTALSALAVRGLRLTKSAGTLLDATAPGAVLAIACIRLSSLFNSSCLSKISIRNPDFQKLPFAYPFTDAAGNEEYRFATFFVEFLILLVLFADVLRFWLNRRAVPAKRGSNRGSVAVMFLVRYCAIEMIADSTRFDSSFARSNGFVSMVQMFCAVCLLVALLFYSIRSVRSEGLRPAHWVFWLCFLAGLAVTGLSEYLVQRHGNWYLSCYAAMVWGCLFMAFSVSELYRMHCEQ